jgi:hypothetical protein
MVEPRSNLGVDMCYPFDLFARLRDLDGTLPPFFRASDSPIAIACFLLVTLLPLRPLRKVPCLRFRIARSTDLCADFP